MQVKAGDTLFYVPNDQRWRKPREVAVEKVGRVWITLASGARINRETLKPEDCSGLCYPSEHAYQQALRRDRLLSKAHQATVSYDRSSITLEQAEQIAAILGLEDDHG